LKILSEYSIQNIKKNKLTSIGTAFSVLVAAVFITTIFILVQSFWSWFVDNEIMMNGNWHSQIANIDGEKIIEAAQDESIDFISMMGDFQTCLFSETGENNYLFIRNCDENYWKNMPDQYYVLSGRIPEKSGEIIVSSKFLQDNPKYQIGSVIVLQEGKRSIEGNEMEFLSVWQEGEIFVPEGIKEFVIVGSMDISMYSAYHGYPSYGYLESKELAKTDDCIAYIRFKNPQVVFHHMPKIADRMNVETDEMGNYEINYNERLLRYYAVLDKRLYGKDIGKLLLVIMLVVILVWLVFWYILKATFLISQKKRNHQLGILKSLGATPGQLQRCILEEGILLSILPIVLADFLGVGFASLILNKYASLMDQLFEMKVDVSYSWVTMVLASMLVMFTVIMSIRGSAREISRLTPIDLVKQQERTIYKDKNRRVIFSRKDKGINIELSQNFLVANRKAFRTSTMMMALCFILVFFFLSTYIISDISNSKSENASNYNISVAFRLTQEIDERLLEEIQDIPNIQRAVHYTDTNVAIWIREDQFRQGILEDGELSVLKENGDILKDDGQYRVTCELVGVEESCFNDYLNQEGFYGFPDSSEYQAAVLEVPAVSDKAENVLNLEAGNNLTIHEKFSDKIDSNVKVSIILAGVTVKAPKLDLVADSYNFRIIVPITSYYNIVNCFLEERSLNHYGVTLKILCDNNDEGNIVKQITDICDKYMGSDDYVISSREIREKNRKNMEEANLLIVYALTVLLALIGLSAEIFSVLNSVQGRRRDFAMLRSVGMDEERVRKVLWHESIIFSIQPFLYAIPILFILIGICLWSFHVTWIEFFKQFPALQMAVYIGMAILIMKFVYTWGNRVILKDKIIDIIKQEYT